MLDDGYGDTLTAYEDWLHHRAHQMIHGTQVRPNGEDHDDLVQHGLIAMWKALDSFDESKGALPAWLTFKASGAMKDALRPRVKHVQHLDLDQVVRPEFTPEACIEYPDLLQGLERAYHAGEVARALDALTPKQREYVRLRFWEGAGPAQMRAHFGYDPQALWSSKRNGAKYKLQERLAHLAA